VGNSALLASCISGQPQSESTGQYIDNSAISGKVKLKLLADREIKSFHISVKSYKGIVQLSGFVNTYREKIRAETLAQSVEGVTEVDNSLIIKKY
jgi:hyperosmotically inducible protein